MSLPFLNHRKIVSVIASRKGKADMNVAPEVEAPSSEMDPGLKSAAEDLMRAIESKSVMDVAKALKSAFEICDSYDEPSEDES